MAAPVTSRGYQRYLLLILLVVQAFNGFDGIALGLVLQSIKVDLALTDTQLGFLGGIAFTLCYAVMGIPIARWADRGDRILIISLTAAVWSVLVAACGLATNFAQLMLIRIGVGIGEAGCVPPAHSLIADYFVRAVRPRAMSIYTMGANVSLIVGYFAAGWLNQLYGWRATFMLLGLPGLVPAALVWLTLREPRRAALRQTASKPRGAAVRVVPSVQRDSVMQVLAILWGNRTFRQLLLCFTVFYFFGYGIQQWQPAFFFRSFHLQSGAIGMWFAGTFGVGGLVGTYVGGAVASRYAANNERRQFRAMALIFIVFGFTSACAYLAPNPYWSLGLLALGVVGAAMIGGPLFSAVQTLVHPDMRAMAIAVIYMCANLVGMGLGPMAVGALSDALHPYVGEESLRYSLVAMCPGYLWVSWHLWRASRTVTADLAKVEPANAAPITAGALA
jgi:MFS family permease